MEIIVRLSEERRALADRINQIDKMLRQYEDLGREAAELLSLTREAVVSLDNVNAAVEAQPIAAAALTPPQRFGTSDNVGTHSAKTPIKEFEAVVIDILRAANRPMDRNELYEALTARGIVIGDGNKANELNALSARVYRMAQDGRLVGQRGVGYSLKTDVDRGGNIFS